MELKGQRSGDENPALCLEVLRQLRDRCATGITCLRSSADALSMVKIQNIGQLEMKCLDFKDWRYTSECYSDSLILPYCYILLLFCRILLRFHAIPFYILIHQYQYCVVWFDIISHSRSISYTSYHIIVLCINYHCIVLKQQNIYGCGCIIYSQIVSCIQYHFWAICGCRVRSIQNGEAEDLLGSSSHWTWRGYQPSKIRVKQICEWNNSLLFRYKRVKLYCSIWDAYQYEGQTILF